MLTISDIITELDGARQEGIIDAECFASLLSRFNSAIMAKVVNTNVPIPLPAPHLVTVEEAERAGLPIPPKEKNPNRGRVPPADPGGKSFKPLVISEEGESRSVCCSDGDECCDE